jgi:hypothetical protein
MGEGRFMRTCPAGHTQPSQDIPSHCAWEPQTPNLRLFGLNICFFYAAGAV